MTIKNAQEARRAAVTFDCLFAHEARIITFTKESTVIDTRVIIFATAILTIASINSSQKGDECAKVPFLEFFCKTPVSCQRMHHSTSEKIGNAKNIEISSELRGIIEQN